MPFFSGSSCCRKTAGAKAVQRIFRYYLLYTANINHTVKKYVQNDRKSTSPPQRKTTAAAFIISPLFAAPPVLSLKFLVLLLVLGKYQQNRQKAYFYPVLKSVPEGRNKISGNPDTAPRSAVTGTVGFTLNTGLLRIVAEVPGITLHPR
jgi:hypothetical protein